MSLETSTPQAPATPQAVEYGFFGRLIRMPVTLLVLFVTLLVLGVISYVKIPVQMMPSGIVEPGLEVYAVNPGASAQENEEQVARVLEDQIRTLSGIEQIESNSGEDQVGIWLQFSADTDMDLAKAEVRDRIERARPLLPKNVTEVGIWSWSNDNLPVMFFGLLHPGDSPRTDFLVDTVIKRRLEAVEGVGKLELWGVLDDSVRIELDEDRVRAANLDLGRLISRLSKDNFALPMGEVTDGGRRVLLRSDMRFKTKGEIEAFPIGNGLTVADVGRVIDQKSVRNRLFRMDGSYAYFGEVQKESQANVVETAHRLNVALKELEADPRLAGEFHFTVFFDQGQFIENSISQLKDAALTGGWLSILILFLFLPRVRLVLCMALSIPISVVLAVAWVYFSGGSFNVLTMAGITLTMGHLVDNAVVVVENIMRVKHQGASNRVAASVGTREVALPVLLSTLSSVVVFLPLIFMTENPVLRIMFGALGLPLCISLLVSLLAALIFLPVAVARVIDERSPRMQRLANAIEPVAAVPGRLLAGLVAGGSWIFHVLLRGLFELERALLRVLYPLRWLAALALISLAVWKGRAALATFGLSRELHTGILPPGGPLGSPTAQLLVHYGLPALLAVLLLLLGVKRWRARPALAPAPPDTHHPESRSLLGLFQDTNRALLTWTLEHRLAASGIGVLFLLSVVIPRSNMAVAAFGEDENTSRLRVEVELEDNFTLAQAEQEMVNYERFFEERRAQYGFQHMGCRFDKDGGQVSLYWDGRRTKEQHDAVQKDVREKLKPRPGHRLRMAGDASNEQRNRNQVTFRLEGPDSEELSRYGALAVKALEQVDGLSGVTSPLQSAPEQVRVVFDSDLAQSLGVSPTSALQNVAWALRGWQLPRFQEPGREVPLIIEYDEEQVAGLGTLKDLEVFNGSSAVPLSTVSHLEFGRGSRNITRRNGKTSFTITARVDDPLRQRELSERGRLALLGLDLPRGYSLAEEDLVGARQDAEMKEIFAALTLSVVLVFLLMGILFESFLLPMSVLFTIPYAAVGAFWTLYLTHTTMDSVGWIGMIILVGVVVNNGIVLIDRIHNLRREGWNRTAAVIEGSRNRVRPILMTALTTVIGLVPMAIVEPSGEGIDYRALAVCVAGGLTFSTFFTLWVVPLAYSVFDDLSQVIAARARWAFRPLRAAKSVSLDAAVG
jgi:hydrophobic/amphiphilic exporter-1 (mainly G- bacteria), HAE1 family